MSKKITKSKTITAVASINDTKKSSKLPVPPRRLIADPKKEGIPVELQTQNRSGTGKLVAVNSTPVQAPRPNPNLPKSVTPEALKIIEQRSEEKKLKARARISVMKAKQSGETQKMPLEGKAALAAIAQAAIENGQPIIKVPSGVSGKVEHKRPDAPKSVKSTKTAKLKKKSTSDAPKSAKKTDKSKKSGAKGELVIKMLKTVKGATRTELCKATGWVGISVPSFVKRAGLKLQKTKTEDGIRYRAV